MMDKKPTQTLCPYTGTPLGESGPTNREHVTPIAIGAPEIFWVKSHEAGNSYWNELIDAPFSNDEGVRFLSMANKVRSRSGDVASQMRGDIVETGDPVKITLTGSGIDIDYVTPVVKLAEAQYLVKGYGDKAVQQAETLQRNLARKGRTAKANSHTLLETPTVHGKFGFDIALVEQQLIKTAYLYTVWCLGDQAIASENRHQYLGALERGGILNADIELCERLEGCHQFTLLVTGGTAYCEVDLFGVFRRMFATKLNPPIEFFAQHSKIDLKNKQFSEEKDGVRLVTRLARRMSSSAR